MAYSSNKMTEGFVFAQELTGNHFRLKLFRLIPLASLRLCKVVEFRRATDREFFTSGLCSFPPFWRHWVWPFPLGMLFCSVRVSYLLKTRGGGKVFVRLQPKLHYYLRVVIANNQPLHDGVKPLMGDSPGSFYQTPSSSESQTR